LPKKKNGLPFMWLKGRPFFIPAYVRAEEPPPLFPRADMERPPPEDPPRAEMPEEREEPLLRPEVPFSLPLLPLFPRDWRVLLLLLVMSLSFCC
jgi:hypothetical protein